MATTQKAFDPTQHLISLKGKDYLEVRWRLVWMRSEHPDAQLSTECLAYADDMAAFKATIIIPSAGSATGHGSEEAKDFGDYYEKAETKAVGRALAALGYGTQFTDEYDFGAEDGRVVDSPVDRAPQQRPAQQQQQQQQQARPQQQQARSPEPIAQLATTRQSNFIAAIIREKGFDPERLWGPLTSKFGTTKDDMTRKQASDIIDFAQGAQFESWAQTAEAGEPDLALDIEDAPF